LDRRYQDCMNTESEYLTFCTFHAREMRNVDNYFSKQVAYIQREIDAKMAKIAKRVKDDFIHSDWGLNTVSREWLYRDGTRILLDKQDATTSAVLKDKLIAQALAKQMPPQKQYETQMQDLVDGKTVM
jgi:hypothetical protein